MSQVFTSNQLVYWDMLDKLGVLHNAMYVVMFERARFEFWDYLTSLPGSEGCDWPVLLVRNEVDYRLPICSEQQVRVTVRLARIGATSMTYAHTLLDKNGELAAEGFTTLVRIDEASRRPIPWSAAYLAMIKPYVIEPETTL